MRTLIAAATMLPILASAANWVAVDPSFKQGHAASDFFDKDLRNNWAEAKASSIYWVRLRKEEDGRFEIAQVSASPIDRSSAVEEILVVDNSAKRAHPAYDNLPSDPAARRMLDCEKADREALKPYTVCNSSFAAPPSGAARLFVGILSGGRSEATLSRVKGERRIFEPASVHEAIKTASFGQEFEEAFPAASESRKQAIALAQNQQLRVAKEAQERLKVAAEDDARSRAALLAKLKRLRVGYKDVCEHSKEALEGGLSVASERLKCINIGEVPNLDLLKEAGFIVTNVQERRPGDRYSALINLEKFE